MYLALPLSLFPYPLLFGLYLKETFFFLFFSSLFQVFNLFLFLVSWLHFFFFLYVVFTLFFQLNEAAFFILLYLYGFNLFQIFFICSFFSSFIPIVTLIRISIHRVPCFFSYSFQFVMFFSVFVFTLVDQLFLQSPFIVILL